MSIANEFHVTDARQCNDVLSDESIDPRNEGLLILRDTVTFEGATKVGKSAIRWTLEIPEDCEVEGLGYINPGFGGVKLSSDPLGKELAQAGMANVRFSPGRKHKTFLSDTFKAQDLHAQTLDAITQDIGDNLLRIKKQAPGAIELDPFRKIIIPHSMGGLSSLLHTLDNPGQVEQVINLAAAGYGSPTPRGITDSIKKGGLASLKHELVPYAKTHHADQANLILKDVLHYYGSNPLRTVGEILSLMKDNDMAEQVSLARQQGVKIGYYAMQYDCLIPPNDEISKTVDHYDEIEGVGHLGPQLKPRRVANRVMQFAQGKAKQGHSRYHVAS